MSPVFTWVPFQAKAERQQREQEVAKAQMSAALSRGASWGMEEDGLEGDEENGEAAHVDWRAYCQTQPLTDKQQKLTDKLRRLERKIQNLTAEADKIKASLLHCSRSNFNSSHACLEQETSHVQANWP